MLFGIDFYLIVFGCAKHHILRAMSFYFHLLGTKEVIANGTKQINAQTCFDAFSSSHWLFIVKLLVQSSISHILEELLKASAPSIES